MASQLEDLIAQLGGTDAPARLAASDGIASAAERGEDVLAALPALGQALADPEPKVRANVAWTFAYLGQRGADLSGQVAALAGTLADANPKVASNCAWSLAQQAPRGDIGPALPGLVALLASDGAFANARAALAAALATQAAPAVRAALGQGLEQSQGSHRARVALLLARAEAGRGQAEALTNLANHNDWYARFGVAKALGELAREKALPASGPALLAGLLGDAGETVREAAATALVSAIERGADPAPALPALAAALGDAALAVRKESIWASVTAALRGHALGPARAPLEARAAEDAHRGNASIGLFLDALNAGRRPEVEAGLEAPHGHTQFAAAYALTEHATRTRDRALLESVLKRIRLGLMDISISQGIAGAIAAMGQRGDDDTFPQQVLSDLINATNDPLVQTPLMGVGMNIRRARGED